MTLRLIVAVAAVTAVTVPPALSQTTLPSASSGSYTLSVTADPATGRIGGVGHVRWLNTSSRAVDEVRLYVCGDAVDGALIDVTSIRSAGQELRGAATWPDAGQSILRVPVRTALAPGGEFNADIQWTARAPLESARGGLSLFARWFPRFLALSDAGWTTRDCRSSELDVAIAAFDVSIDVPTGWNVAATGRELVSTSVGGRDRHRFVEAPVRDFAWAATRDALDRRVLVERSGAPPIVLRMLIRPEHARQIPRIESALREALSNQSARLPYALSTLVVVDMPWQRASSRTVFPGMIAITPPWFEPPLGTQTEAEIAGALSAHFWTCEVGVDTVTFPKLAQGLTTYSASRLLNLLVRRRLDSTLGESFLVERFFGGFVPLVVRSVRSDPFVDNRSRRGSVLWLLTLERYLGSPTLDAILSEFSGPSAPGRPTPERLADVAQTVTGRDLRWFFDQVFRDGVVFDYGVGGVVVRRLEGSEHAFRTRVDVVRSGDGVFSGSSRPRVGPYESGRAMEIDVWFRDGTVRQEHWDGRDPLTTFEYESRSSIDRVMVDPNGVLQLDISRTNNTWSSSPWAPAAANRWSAAWMTWLEHWLLGCGALV